MLSLANMTSQLTVEHLLRRTHSIQLLKDITSSCPEQLSAKTVWKYFLLLTEIPRPSHKLGAVTQKLQELAQALGCDCKVDKAGNVVFRKEAALGYENVPGICLQAHMDMVCSANSCVHFNFDTQPIECFIEGDWLKARNTTLGADNGLGLAAALAVLEESNAHGTLECLFTADEETTMGGAENLDADVLSSKVLLNVDSEEEHSICIGCAGGAENDFTLDVDWTELLPSSVTLLVSLSGLRGGHSGIDINKGRANALKLMGAILLRAFEEVPSLLACSIAGGGQPNVIPRECVATLLVEPSEERKAMDALYRWFEVEKQQLEHEQHAALNCRKHSEKQLRAISREKTIEVLKFLCGFPSGVIKMSEDVDGLVESSINLASCSTTESTFSAHSFTRSSIASEVERVQVDLEARFAKFSVSAPQNSFPGWHPDIAAKSFQILKDAHGVLFGYSPRVYAVHAGLECGFIQEAYPSMECVSIGPEIHHAHSPEEAAMISSVPRFYRWLSFFIEEWAKQHLS